MTTVAPVSPEQAVRAWLNGNSGIGVTLAGLPGMPAWRGAYLRSQRSPANGTYLTLGVLPPRGTGSLVAEGAGVQTHHLGIVCYAGTLEAAENAAAVVARAIRSQLTGVPQRMGDSGVTCLVADNVVGPVLVPTPPDGGEQYMFSVDADFVMTVAW